MNLHLREEILEIKKIFYVKSNNKNRVGNKFMTYWPCNLNLVSTWLGKGLKFNYKLNIVDLVLYYV